MVKNFIKIAWRSLLKHKFFSIINVLGLSVSMSVCLLIILMIQDQMSYDGFNPNKEDIYRVIHTRIPSEVDFPLATVPMPVAQTLEDQGVGIEEVITFRRGLRGDVVRNGKAIGLSGYFTNPTVLKVFSLGLKQGNPETALKDPFSVILKEEVAKKMFGDKEALGELIEIGDLGSFRVTGILEATLGKSHLEFDALSSIGTVATLEAQDKIFKANGKWDESTSGWVYMLMPPGQEPDHLAKLLAEEYGKSSSEDAEYRMEFQIQSMSDITPGPLIGNQIGTAMPIFFVYGLGILAFIIIASAGFNYTNLSIARALTRAREVGIRKVNGAKKEQIFLQFMFEALVVAVFSLGVAILMLHVLIPAFESLSTSKILSWNLAPNLSNYLWFFAFSLLSGILAGAFPAWMLSSFQPTVVLKNLNTVKVFSKLGLRKILIVVQFSLCLILIISVTLVYKQIRFMITEDYGFNKENIVNIDLQGQEYKDLKFAYEQLSFVKTVAPASNIPSTGLHNDAMVKLDAAAEPEQFYYFASDAEYIDLMELELIAGSNFPKDLSGGEKYVIVNRTGAATIGFEDGVEEVLGRSLIIGDSTNVQVIGVIEDYNYMMLYADIHPLMLRNKPDYYNWAQVQMKAGSDVFANLEMMEQVWDEFDPNHTFEYKFFDAQIEEFYAFFYDIVYIVGLISILAISIACMGLLGMATYTAETRMKEIGIRKVLGARVMSLVGLLGRSYFTLLLVSVFIAAPLAYFGNQLWLDEFSYRVEFGIGTVGMGIGIMVLLGALIIGSQAYRASNTNPIDHLRGE